MNRINILLEKYKSRLSTEQEEKELYELIAADENEIAIKAWLMDVMEKEVTAEIDKGKWDGVLKQILSEARDEWSVVSGEKENSKVRPLTIWKRVAVAASLVGVLLVGYWLIKDKTIDDGQQTTNPLTALRTDVKAPDKNRAMITLADGSTVYLDSAANGTLFMQGNISVTKTADGKLVYTTANGVETPSGLVMNTLSNPRGSKVIDMTLSDGSHVWLNAGSSVTYAVAFVGNERKVNITGEAYFEVADDKTKPFIVRKGETSVQVLGTHFNVNAYDDEDAIRVTLLEGSVRVSNNTGAAIIKPGQQSIVTNHQQPTISNQIDLGEVMAWKNGMFQFENTSIEDIMKQVARWYDVNVVFEAEIKDGLNGTIPRNVSATNLFKILELTGKVHFRIEGKNVVVTR
jgi:transmembrane sensor